MLLQLLVTGIGIYVWIDLFGLTSFISIIQILFGVLLIGVIMLGISQLVQLSLKHIEYKQGF